MPALYQPEILRRAVADPNAVAAEVLQLVARKAKTGKKGKSKIKGGAIAGIIIGVIILILVICIILFLVKRSQKKKALTTAH